MASSYDLSKRAHAADHAKGGAADLSGIIDGILPSRLSDAALKATSDARYPPILGGFPPAPGASNPAQVTAVQVKADANTCSHPINSGARTVFTAAAAPGRYAWLGDAGAPYTYTWNGNDVLRAGTTKADIGVTQSVFRCRTNASWIMLESQLAPGGTFDGLIQVRVNGVNIWQTPQTFTGTYAGAFAGIDLTFADTAWKTVEIFQVGWPFAINYSTGATMQAWQVTGQKKLLIVGDSWTTGTGQSSPHRSFAAALQTSSAWDVSYNGQGGTGYVGGGTDPWNSPYGAAPRLVAVTDYQPDVLVVLGSINDNGKTGIQTAASAYYSAVKTVSPNTKIIVVGPQIGDSSNPATDAALRAAAAAATNVIGYASPYADGWDLAGVRGPSDMVHPSNVGAEWYARLVQAAVRKFTSAIGDASW